MPAQERVYSRCRRSIACPFDELRAPSLSRGKQAPTVSRLLAFSRSQFSARLPPSAFRLSLAFRFSPFAFLLLAVAALLLVPANGPDYNRFWQALMIPSDDLQLKPVLSNVESVINRQYDITHLRLVTTPIIAYVVGVISPRNSSLIVRGIGQSVTEPLNRAVGIALSSQLKIESKYPMLTRDPSAANPSRWVTVAGSPPEFLTGINDSSASSTALQNPPGRCTQVFTSDLILLDPQKSYRVEFSIRQTAGRISTAYLAMAWYDDREHLLASNIPNPAGAGFPDGWKNGTYSYFGLVGGPPPHTWTIFRKSFGLGETAAIPSYARFVRIGALLNYNSTPAATIQLTNIRLWQKSEAEFTGDDEFRSDQPFLFVLPSTQMVWTSASQTAQMSHHWPAQQVATDLAGVMELVAAARLAGAKPMDLDGIVFELDEYTKSSAANQ